MSSFLHKATGRLDRGTVKVCCPNFEKAVGSVNRGFFRKLVARLIETDNIEEDIALNER